MAPDTKNAFLDSPGSEDEDNGYDSEEITKGGGRSAKRRKVDGGNSKNDASDSEPDDDVDEPVDDGLQGEEAGKDQGEGTDGKPASTKKAKEGSDLPDISRPLTKKNLVASDAAIKKSGVVYLSRIPPFMKPVKLRSLLEPYGTINRIFLAPEDPTAHARRVRSGGNKKRTYTEGWVEFVNKKEAKRASELLNANIIGGKKGSYYHDDLWNLLYLKGFKWHHLTEQIAAEDAERASRMRAEISKTTKENKDFVRNVERAKMLDGMQAKAKTKRKAQDDEDEVPQAARSFRQISQVKKTEEEQPAHVTRVLSKIF